MSDQAFSIGAVVKLTGLSTHTIRIWERRHQAVIVNRLESGHRVYRQTDIDRLLLLKKCAKLGKPVSKTAKMSNEELKNCLHSLILTQQDTPKPNIISSNATKNLPKTSDNSAAFKKPKIGVFGSHTISNLLAPAQHFSIIHMSLEWQQLRHDIEHYKPKALVLELPSLTDDALYNLTRLLHYSSTNQMIVIYRFANQEVKETLKNFGIVLMRAPLEANNLIENLEKLCAISVEKPHTPKPMNPPLALNTLSREDTPPLFSTEQLSQLSNIPQKIGCECPHHLAEIITSLNAFEQYSSSCSNENALNTILHNKIQLTAAKARHMLESLLKEILTTENIKH